MKQLICPHPNRGIDVATSVASHLSVNRKGKEACEVVATVESLNVWPLT